MVVNKCYLSFLSCVTASIDAEYITGLQRVPFPFPHPYPEEALNQWLALFY
jgi:hypothetical protein